ncbi:hypothetical protein BDP27DRAFT_448646 [Rhodocollybia butyracea]|uniref:Uncharacterized protein n=1 Tax=Rhodocollybia butyracea TaxID=206335 RepID=A0A9P5TYF9_9AGAR|nr:hypothetical protein BDP27DRAFT_448646 [Rhodocollybia butyracea]
MGDEDSQSTPRFRKRRQADQNYASRNKPMAPRCPSIVWLALQASTFDSLNWYCNSCGKLNRQRFFRRRKCSSSFCMDAPITACRVQQLEHIRFIGQQSPLVFPLNNMPKYIDLFTVITEWDDGMRTVAYPVWNKNIMERILEEAEEQIHSVASPFGPCIFSGGISTADFASRTVKQEALEYLPSNNVPEVTRVERILQSAQVYGLPHLAQHIRDIENKKKVMAKHLFTCNDPRLQDEQTELLGSIQETLVLQKMALDNSPYFSYVAGLVHGNSFASDYINSNVQPVPWEDAPPCIEQARGLMHHLATVYGEISELPLLTQLTVLGWTATGRKKVSQPLWLYQVAQYHSQGEHCLRAKEKTIVIMVLGHELGVRIVPKSGFPANSLRLNKVDMNQNRAC